MGGTGMGTGGPGLAWVLFQAALESQLLLAKRAELRDQIVRPRVALHALLGHHDLYVVRNLSEREQRFPAVSDELVVRARVLRHDVKLGLKRALVFQHAVVQLAALQHAARFPRVEPLGRQNDELDAEHALQRGNGPRVGPKRARLQHLAEIFQRVHVLHEVEILQQLLAEGQFGFQPLEPRGVAARLGDDGLLLLGLRGALQALL